MKLGSAVGLKAGRVGIEVVEWEGHEGGLAMELSGPGLGEETFIGTTADEVVEGTSMAGTGGETVDEVVEGTSMAGTVGETVGKLEVEVEMADGEGTELEFVH